MEKNWVNLLAPILEITRKFVKKQNEINMKSTLEFVSISKDFDKVSYCVVFVCKCWNKIDKKLELYRVIRVYMEKINYFYSC